MRPRQPPPRLWLVSDERMAGGLLAAMARLPRGAGVIFRHRATPSAARARLFAEARGIARARRLTLLLAGSPREAIGWRADGAYGRSPHRAGRRLVHAAPAHDPAELVAARRAGAGLVLVSPAFATRSHPGARPLGPLRFGLLAARARGRAGWPKVVALGGMDAHRFMRLRPLGADGWAAIDSLSAAGARADQKRKVVPR